MSGLTHFDAKGDAHMVDVSDKDVTSRTATAKGAVKMAPETLAMITEGRAKKGDVLAVARLAGIMAAKKTPDLIPLCHPLMLDKVTVEVSEAPDLPGLRIEAMAKGVEDVADLPDPVGSVMSSWTRPNGLEISRVRTPIGVIGIIYESRPNVTADAGALCLKSGNAAILRGGSDGFKSSGVIVECLQAGLADAGLPATAIQMVPTGFSSVPPSGPATPEVARA